MRKNNKYFKINISFFFIFLLFFIANVANTPSISLKDISLNGSHFQPMSTEKFELLDNWDDENESSLSVFVEKTNIYLVKFFGFEIYNATNPENLQFLGQWGKEHIPIRSLFVEDGIAYIINSFNLTLVDVSNPSNPENISTIKLNTDFLIRGASIEVKDKIAYIFYNFYSLTLTVGYGFIVVDCSNTNNLVILDEMEVIVAEMSLDIRSEYNALLSDGKTLDSILFSNCGIALYRNHVICVWLGIIFVFDITDLENVVLIKTITLNEASFRDINLKNKLAFIADYNFGLRIYDISNINSIVLTKSIKAYDPTQNETAQPITISVDNNYVYLACETDGLRAINITDINNPTYAGSYMADNCTVSDVYAVGNVVFVSDFWRNLDVVKLKVVDIIWPPTPTSSFGLVFYNMILIFIPIILVHLKHKHKKL